MISFLDTDLYKLTMQQAIRRCFPRASASHLLYNRNELALPQGFGEKLDQRLRALCRQMVVTSEELEWLRGTGFFTAGFLRYLADYRFDRGELDFSISPGGQFELSIRGTWQSTVLWEVPLLTAIHEVFHEQAQPDGAQEGAAGEHYLKVRAKAERLLDHGCHFAEVGTRRRLSPTHQEAAVRACRDISHERRLDRDFGFLGTSNMHFARKFNVRPFDTTAHEWIMGHSVFSDLETANRDALLRWMQIYGRRATIALTDTYTTALFFENFERVLAEAYTTIRHDSGDPFRFIDQALAFYEAMGINAREKTILFSDRIDVDQAVEIKRYLGRRAKAAFALGTPPEATSNPGRQLDMVIRLHETNGHSVCKLSDDLEQATGPRRLVEAVAERVENHTRASPHYPS